MDAIYNAVKKALAEKGIDVQSEYNKSAKNLCGVNIPPNKTKSRKHIHKGILHSDHIILKNIGGKDE